MVSRRFKQTTRRTLANIGRDITLTHFTDDGTTDEHGDPTRTVASTETVSGILRRGENQPQVVSGPDGQDIAYDVTIYLPDSATVDVAEGDSRYPTELTDSEDNVTYRPVSVWHEGNGQIRVAAVTAS